MSSFILIPFLSSPFPASCSQKRLHYQNLMLLAIKGDEVTGKKGGSEVLWILLAPFLAVKPNNKYLKMQSLESFFIL